MTPTAIVTGAGSGIGRATARALHEAGYNVVLAGRRAEALEDTARGFERMMCVPTDVTDPDAVAHLFEQAKTRFGRIDLLFNNAGTNVHAVPFDELTVEQLRSVIDVNVTGSLLCAREAFRYMKAQSPQGGHIINNGSISAQSPRPHSAPYTASKHAITGLTKALNLDGRPYHIRCGQIDIGNAVSEMSAYMQSGALQADGQTRVEPRMDVNNAARMVVYMAGLPPEANIPFVTVMAAQMPLYGRG
jgi:NAD(P)-dependent dehydrogenase (short-subunit alcohol dehydrogenase family)